MEVIDWSFVVGMLVGVNLAGIFYWAQMRRVREADREFRAEQGRRFDELKEWSARQFDQARKDVGLPPRSMS